MYPHREDWLLSSCPDAVLARVRCLFGSAENESHAHQLKRTITLTGEGQNPDIVLAGTLVGQELESESVLSDWSLSGDIEDSLENLGMLIS